MANYHDGDVGSTYYAKPRPIVETPWEGDAIAGIPNGTSGEFSFPSLDPTKDYRVYEQAGASPASSDTHVASFFVDHSEFIPRAEAPLAAGEAAQRTLDDAFTDTIQEKIRKVP